MNYYYYRRKDVLWVCLINIGVCWFAGINMEPNKEELPLSCLKFAAPPKFLINVSRKLTDIRT